MTVDVAALFDTYIEHYGDRLRYIPEVGAHEVLVRLDDGRWRLDATLHTRWYARTVCHDASTQP